MWKRAAMVIAAALLGGCVIVDQRVTDTVLLKADEGLIVFRTSCERPVGAFSIYPVGTIPNALSDSFGAPAKVQYCMSKPGLRSFVLPAGEYYLAIFWGPNTSYVESEVQAHRFRVSSGVINYIGDLNIQTRGQDRTILFYVDVRDLQEETLEVARGETPSLLSRYTVVKWLAAQAR